MELRKIEGDQLDCRFNGYGNGDLCCVLVESTKHFPIERSDLRSGVIPTQVSFSKHPPCQPDPLAETGSSIKVATISKISSAYASLKKQCVLSVAQFPADVRPR